MYTDMHVCKAHRYHSTHAGPREQHVGVTNLFCPMSPKVQFRFSGCGKHIIHLKHLCPISASLNTLSFLYISVVMFFLI